MPQAIPALEPDDTDWTHDVIGLVGNPRNAAARCISGRSPCSPPENRLRPMRRHVLRRRGATMTQTQDLISLAGERELAADEQALRRLMTHRSGLNFRT